MTKANDDEILELMNLCETLNEERKELKEKLADVIKCFTEYRKKHETRYSMNFPVITKDVTFEELQSDRIVLDKEFYICDECDQSPGHRHLSVFYRNENSFHCKYYSGHPSARTTLEALKQGMRTIYDEYEKVVLRGEE